MNRIGYLQMSGYILEQVPNDINVIIEAQDDMINELKREVDQRCTQNLQAHVYINELKMKEADLLNQKYNLHALLKIQWRKFEERTYQQPQYQQYQIHCNNNNEPNSYYDSFDPNFVL